MWKTFLFRFGLLSRLFNREFPILLFVPVHFLLFIGEKALRIFYIYYQKDANGLYGTPVTIYDDWRWHLIFWTKIIVSIICYAGCIKTAIYVMHPSYYKPYRWFH